jgi:hypothetical protein
VENAVCTESDMSHIWGRMSDKISDEVSASFDFLLDFSLSLFKHTPFWKVAIDKLYIIVFAVIVDLNFNEAIFSCFNSLVHNLQIIVI